MAKENWLEKQIREARQDPRVIAVKEMIAAIVEVKDPKKIISIDDVPEFGMGVVGRGIVKKVVGQGQVGSTEDLPIRTDNASDCNIFLIKTPRKDGPTQYSLVHVWAGDLDLNLPGAKQKDIAALTNKESVAIGITGGRSASITATAMDLKHEGITTVKHIHVPTDNRYVSTVYRPETNEILIRIGADVDATEVWIYDGF